MTDFMLNVRRVETRKMPKSDGDYTGYPNVVRASGYSPCLTLLQIRGEKTMASTYLTKDQVYELIEALQCEAVRLRSE